MCDLENPQTLKNSGCTALKPDTAKIFIKKTGCLLRQPELF